MLKLTRQTLGPEPCPICGQIVRKNTFAAQTFENLRVQKEVGIRRRVADMCVRLRCMELTGQLQQA